MIEDLHSRERCSSAAQRSSESAVAFSALDPSLILVDQSLAITHTNIGAPCQDAI